MRDSNHEQDTGRRKTQRQEKEGVREDRKDRAPVDWKKDEVESVVTDSAQQMEETLEAR